VPAASAKDRGAVEGVIPVLDAATIDPDTFYRRFVLRRRPALIRGGLGIDDQRRSGSDTTDAPGLELAAAAHSFRSISYLREHAGDAMVRVEYKTAASSSQSPSSSSADGKSIPSFGRGVHDWMSFSRFLRHMQRDPSLPDDDPHKNHALYLTSQPIPPASPADCAAHPHLGLEDGAPSALCVEPISSLLHDLPLRPKILNALIPVQINMWMGGYKDAPLPSKPSQHDSSTNGAGSSVAPSPFHRSPGSTSGLHHDFHDNIYALVMGHKYFHIYPPSSAPDLYTYGMKDGYKLKQDDDDDNDAGEASDDESDPAQSGNHCIIHPNGVIEYLSASDYAETESDAQQATKKNKVSTATSQRQLKQKLKQQQMEEVMRQEEEEENGNEEAGGDDGDGEDEQMEGESANDGKRNGASDSDNADEDEDDDPCAALLAEDSEARSLHSTRLSTLQTQLSDLRSSHSTVSTRLRMMQRSGIDGSGFGAESKKFKHLMNESMGLEKKILQIQTRMNKLEEEEKKRQEEMKQRMETAKAEASAKKKGKNAATGGATNSDDDSDEDDDSFPDIDELEDDYVASDEDDGNTAEGGEDDELDGEDQGEKGDDNDDDDASIDSAEREAWRQFMEKTSKKAKQSKRKAVDDSSSAPSKKAKNGPTSTSASSIHRQHSSSTSTPSSAEFFPPNFSQLDFTRMTPKHIRKEFPRFHALASKAPASASSSPSSSPSPSLPLVVEVRQGDMLYLPASWFHEVFSCGIDESERNHPVDSDSLHPSVHLALNWWFQPPSSSVVADAAAASSASFSPSSMIRPYDASDLDVVKRWKRFYLSRTQQMIEQKKHEHREKQKQKHNGRKQKQSDGQRTDEKKQKATAKHSPQRAVSAPKRKAESITASNSSSKEKKKQKQLRTASVPSVTTKHKK